MSSLFLFVLHLILSRQSSFALRILYQHGRTIWHKTLFAHRNRKIVVTESLQSKLFVMGMMPAETLQDHFFPISLRNFDIHTASSLSSFPLSTNNKILSNFRPLFASREDDPLLSPANVKVAYCDTIHSYQNGLMLLLHVPFPANVTALHCDELGSRRRCRHHTTVVCGQVYTLNGLPPSPR